MVPPIPNNCTELGLNGTLSNSSYNASNCTDIRLDTTTSSVDIKYIAIGVAALVALVVIIFIVVGIVVGMSRCAVQRRRKQGGNGDPTVDSDNSAYIFMEDARVSAGQKVGHKPTDTSEWYVKVTEHQTLHSEAQDYEVPRSSSSEEIDSQHHQYENRSSWVDGQPPAYENHEVTPRPSQEGEKRGLSLTEADGYENQEIIEALFRSGGNLDATLSASYVAPNPLPSSEGTNSKTPTSRGPTYINTPSNKRRPNKAADKHTYLTIVQ